MHYLNNYVKINVTIYTLFFSGFLQNKAVVEVFPFNPWLLDVSCNQLKKCQ